MDEKKIIKRIKYLWLFSGITYIIPALLILNWINSWIVNRIPAWMQQSPVTTLVVTFTVVIAPLLSYLVFIGVSFIILYFLIKEKYQGIKYSIIFASFSLIIYGLGTAYILIFLRDSIGIDGILFLILNSLILLVNIIIINLSLKPEIKELIK